MTALILLMLAVGCTSTVTPGPTTTTDTGPTGPTGPPTGDTGATEAGGALTVLSLNLHCFKLEGTPFASNNERFAAVAEVVAAEAVDAIALQEACVSDAEGAAIDRLALALEAATGTAWGSAWEDTHPAWEGTPDEAEEGVGILVRGGEPLDVQSVVYVRQGPLRREALAATVTASSGASARLYTVHLDFDDGDARRAQARETALHALVHADPATWATLIAGDYNAVAADPALVELEGAGFARLSAASDPDGAEIDHVLAPIPAGFEVLESRLVLDGASGPWVSDHPGVLVRLEVGPPAAAVVTRFAATHDAGFGHHLALRGGTAPLDWELGWPAVNTAADRWEAAFLGWSAGTIAYKWLVDDVTWEAGDDHTVEAGATGDVAPTF
jgi:endonuclease/exonuclease/phosphatase family metal-dependent hydrolase